MAGAGVEEVSSDLKHLLEMGFGETESRSALLNTDNNLMEASVILITNASRCVTGLSAPSYMITDDVMTPCHHIMMQKVNDMMTW